MSQQLCRCCNINFLVGLMVILFGVASWVDINGLWVELPILVQNLPEGWDLPSYMAVIIQIANIAPLVFTIAITLWPRQVLDVPVIYVIIALGALSCLLLAFLWDVTSEIAGTQHSTALFVLQFCLALVDCTSSVAFLPFMSIYKPQYMTAYFIGEGFSGLIPSLVALGQGAGNMECVKFPNNQASGNQTFQTYTDSINYTRLYNASYFITTTSPHFTNVPNVTTETPSFSVFPMYKEPRFTVQTFFLILMSLLIVSFISFTLLHNWSYCKKEQVAASPFASLGQTTQNGHPLLPDSPNGDTEGREEQQYVPNGCHMNGRSETDTSKSVHKPVVLKAVMEHDHPHAYHKQRRSLSTASVTVNGLYKRMMSRPKYALFLLLTAYLNALTNGVLPSLQTYSCLPYGIQPYHLSVTLANIANPVACLLSFFLKVTAVSKTLLLSAVGSGLAAYLILTAATSPEPPLVEHPAGPTILILCWVLVIFILTFTKVCIAMEFRKEGKKALLWTGASQQAGSLAGALITFVFVNVLKKFQVANPCMRG